MSSNSKAVFDSNTAALVRKNDRTVQNIKANASGSLPAKLPDLSPTDATRRAAGRASAAAAPDAPALPQSGRHLGKNKKRANLSLQTHGARTKSNARYYNNRTDSASVFGHSANSRAVSGIHTRAKSGTQQQAISNAIDRLRRGGPSQALSVLHGGPDERWFRQRHSLWRPVRMRSTREGWR